MILKFQLSQRVASHEIQLPRSVSRRVHILVQSPEPSCDPGRKKGADLNGPPCLILAGSCLVRCCAFLLPRVRLVSVALRQTLQDTCSAALAPLYPMHTLVRF
jgi:hypothetical protein